MVYQLLVEIWNQVLALVYFCYKWFISSHFEIVFLYKIDFLAGSKMTRLSHINFQAQPFIGITVIKCKQALLFMLLTVRNRFNFEVFPQFFSSVICTSACLAGRVNILSRWKIEKCFCIWNKTSDTLEKICWYLTRRGIKIR